ncbi:MAG: YebY family protein [Candidatus Cloacimonetes bacterium]|nr:YebY family protein [Candidatus Cloacimonadota bacterium]
MKKCTLFAAIAAIFLLSGCQNYAEKKITEQEYGEKWAFTSAEASLRCYKDGDIKAPVVVLDGKSYGLTGFADAKYGQNDVNALNPYWKKDTRAGKEGLRVDLGTITNDANKLCEGL